MTGLTIANTDIQLHKAGATTLANKNSGGGTHISAGRYYAVLDATDTNTLGNLEVHSHASGALPIRREFVVLPAAIYDGLVAGTMTEPTAIPAATVDPFSAIAALLAFTTNPIIQTASSPATSTLRNRANSTDIGDATITVNSGVDTRRTSYS